MAGNFELKPVENTLNAGFFGGILLLGREGKCVGKGGSEGTTKVKIWHCYNIAFVACAAASKPLVFHV